MNNNIPKRPEKPASGTRRQDRPLDKWDFQRHAPFYTGLVLALCSTASAWFWPVQLTVVLATVTFFSSYLLLTALRLPLMSADYLCNNAAEEDEPATIILLVALMAVSVSIGSLFWLTSQKNGETILEFSLSLASVALGWLSIHTMFALHYAHIYWQPEDLEIDAERAGAKRGLDFPGTHDPSIADFLYFAFVIGMTAQTSDVAISSTLMRKASLSQGIVAFFFNTVLVAAAVNVALASA